MVDRAVKVTLSMSADQYKSEADKAKKATDEIGDAQDQVGKKSQEAAQQSEAAAQRQREAWNAVGTGLVAAGTGVAILGAAMLKTGIEYNTLQQTTRAALTTLLGSAEAAADQMDRLDEFARNSPFSKAVFLQAQQQMLAFGIEARKVVPYLDAIQNAVAASGGSNDDIAGIAATMAKIQSSAKITAEDLNELGGRGVNAAELIGSQMGKTGAQIREEISSGSLGATEALDALAAGMSDRFDGAADDVKNTFAGAFDRVKAAWRDLSSALAEPFVGSEGGGLLTDLLNSAADLMRTFEALPGPVQGGVVTFIALAGAAAFLQGSLILLGPKIDEAKQKFNEMDKGAIASAAAWRGAAAALSAGLIALGPTISESNEKVGGLVNTAALAAAGFATTGSPWGAAIGGSIGLLQMFSSEAINVQGDLKALTATLDEQSGAITKSTASWVSNQIITSGASEVFKDAGLSISTVTDAVLGDVAAQREFFDTLNKGKGDTFQATVLYAELGGQVQEASVAHRDSKEAMEDSAVAAEDLAAQVAQQTEQWLANAEAQIGASNATIAQVEAQIAANETIAAGDRIVRDAAGAYDYTSEATRNVVTALNDLAEKNTANIESMRESGASSAELDAALAVQRQSFIDTAIQMGLTAEEAQALADKYGQIPRSVPTEVSLTKAEGYDAIYNGLIFNLDQLSKPRTAKINVSAGVGLGGLAGVGAPTLASLLLGGSYAEGGAIAGPGTGTSDSILARVSNGEHVLTAAEVRAMGGHDEVYRMRASLRGYATGGAVEYVGSGRSYAGPVATPSSSSTYSPSVAVTVVGRPTASDRQIGQSAAQEAVFQLASSGGIGS